ncbi:MAG: hypothetical protein A2901_07785 [Elusimicrobia bacterium RIFCSPLOWO2_01_FULL_54_10]|nr:MAG: hypothetical protein A2901_07785 [Elusimicrobia bacterium RIFCSPLOWO2_01_FULL_54_10]
MTGKFWLRLDFSERSPKAEDATQRSGFKMKITVEIRSHYGREFAYVVGEGAAELEILTGQKTLAPRHIGALRNLGFEIEVRGAAPGAIWGQ